MPYNPQWLTVFFPSQHEVLLPLPSVLLCNKARAGRFWNASPHLALLANNDKVAIPQIQVVSQLCRSAKGRWWELWQVALFTVHSHIRPFAPPHLSNNYSSEDWRWSCSVRSLYHAHKYHCVKASWHIWAHFHNWRPPSRQVYWIIGRCLHTLTQAGTHLPAL